MNQGKGLRPLIHDLYQQPLSGEDIERRSFAIIDAEAPHHDFTADEWQVVRRLIHTTGDFGIMGSVRFSPHALDAAATSLGGGKPLYVDSAMIRAGISLKRLQAVRSGYTKGDIHCHVADADVAAEAAAAGLPRSIFAVRKAKTVLAGGIAVFGNAPAALLELNRMIAEEEIRPSLVIAMPVGFVHVEESKTELLSLGVPCVVLTGRRGGRPLAVSVVHALCTLALAAGREAGTAVSAVTELSSSRGGDEAAPAVILIGHGSRVAGAGESMERVAESVRLRLPGTMVETCAMSMLGPHLPETLRKCVAAGARKVIVLPYFLYMGVHLREDIPKIMREEGQAYPGVELILGKNLGFDASLVDLVIRRLAESRGLEDIRARAPSEKEA